MELDSPMMKTPKRPANLNLSPLTRSEGGRRRRRPLFRRADDGRRNSLGVIGDEQIRSISGFEQRACSPVLDSPFRYGKRALRRWSSTQIASGGAVVTSAHSSPARSPRSPRPPPVMRVLSMPCVDENSVDCRSSPTQDYVLASSPVRHACMQEALSPIEHKTLRDMRNCSLPIITVTPHGVSTECSTLRVDLVVATSKCTCSWFVRGIRCNLLR